MKKSKVFRITSALLSVLMLVTLLAPQFVFAKDQTYPDGTADNWVIDPLTNLDTAATPDDEQWVNAVEEYRGENWRHLVSGKANGNAEDGPKYPAAFVLCDEGGTPVKMTENGFFEATILSPQAASHNRFGIYINYEKPNDTFFVGFDNGGWFWQRYNSAGGGDWYRGTRIAAPQANEEVTLRFEWEGKKLTKATANGVDMFPNLPEDFSDIGGSGTSIAMKSGSFSSDTQDDRTDIYIKDIHHSSQNMVWVYNVAGTVTGEDNQPVAGATLTMGGKTTITEADGSYSFGDVFLAGSYELAVEADRYVGKTQSITITDDDLAGADFVLDYTDWAFGPDDGALDDWKIDPATAKGGEVNEVVDGMRHFKSEAGNTNNPGASNTAAYFYLDGYEMPDEGFFEATVLTKQAPSWNRGGFHLNYADPGNGLLVGFDNGGWFWQNYSSNSGSWYEGTRQATPQQDVPQKVRLEWSGKSLTVATVNGVDMFPSMPHDFSSIGGDGKKIGFKAGSLYYNEQQQVTDVYLYDVTYTGQQPGTTVPAYQTYGRVVDSGGTPIAGAVVKGAGKTVTTGADGLFALQGIVAGTYTVEITCEDYRSASRTVTITDKSANLEDIALRLADDGTVALTTDEMTVDVDPFFPRVAAYNMASGAVVDGQPNALDVIRINGTNVVVSETTSEVAPDGKSITYTIPVQSGATIDAVLTVVIAVEGNTLTFDITDVENKLDEWTHTISTIEIPNHSLVSVRGTNGNPNFAGAVMANNVSTTGDRFYTLAEMSNGSYNYGFVSTDEISAGLWSNSEVGGANSTTRVTVDVSGSGSSKAMGLRSSYWYYQRKIKGERGQKDDSINPQDANGYYLVDPVEMPHAAVAIADGDVNGSGNVDWQDGAIEFRKIMNELQGGDETPDVVAWRIVMNFGSQTQNPFLMTLDNVKRIAMHTDGLGQSVLLKGYANEGHDSGHPDYADIGQRIGGAEDMKYLLEKGGEYGAKFGIHINAGEMYPEAKAFDNDLVRRTGSTETSGLRYGWNWIDQGIGIDSRFDHGSGRRLSRLEALHEELGGDAADKLSFVYLDIWGNGTGSAEDGWDTRNVVSEINSQGWKFGTEFGGIAEGYSTFQHWSTDLSYGDASSKGHNSSIMRFIRNHERDTWTGEITGFGGAGVAPLLGGNNMKDFEGWQGRSNYDEYVKNLFAFNVTTKFLQHYKVTEWEYGPTVGSYTTDKKITLKNDAGDTVVAERVGNTYSTSATSDFRDRTITLNGKVILTGRMAIHNSSAVQTQTERYLVPWYWDGDGNLLPDNEKKLYHFNQDSANLTSEWELPDDWDHLASVRMYELTDLGRTNEVEVRVVDGKITITAKKDTPYVLYQGEAQTLSDVVWSDGMHVWDAGFNSGKLDHWTKTGEGSGALEKSATSNWMLVQNGEVEMSQPITGLTPGENYVAYVGVDNRSDARAWFKIMDGDKVLASNYTVKSIAQNFVQADPHNINNATYNGGLSYFQNIYLFFEAPEDTSNLRLVLAREAGSGGTYWDNIRVTESGAYDDEANVKESYTTADGLVLPKRYTQNFEQVPAGLYPFVISHIDNRYKQNGVEDNGVHLSEKHAPYTQAGWDVKKMDDVLEGNWSVKVNNLDAKSRSHDSSDPRYRLGAMARLIMQTIPQMFRFEPGVTYEVSFDYQVGSPNVYKLVYADTPYLAGTASNFDNAANLTVKELEYSLGSTQTYTFELTGSEGGQTWFGFFAEDEAANTQGTSGSQAAFGGYEDLVVDNIQITVKSEVTDWVDLLALVEEAAALEEEDFSPADWAKLQAALEDADDLIADGSAAQAEVDAMAQALEKAMDPNGSTAALKALYDQLYTVYTDEEFDGDLYTANSLERFTDALAAAKDIIDSASPVLPEEIEAAYNELQAAYLALTPRGDIDLLTTFYESFKNLPETKYTAESYAPMKAALAAAKLVLDDAENATVAQVDAAMDALWVAYEGLNEATSIDVLRMAIGIADDLLKTPGQYIESSVNNLQKVLAEVRPLLDKADATQKEITDAVIKVADALSLMFDKGNTTALELLVRGAESMNQNLYTPETWAVLETVLKNAKDGLAKPDDLLQEEIDALYKALENAIRGLVASVNKSDLETAIKVAEEIVKNKDKYIPNTINGLEEELAKAKAVYNNPNATKDQVANAAKDLMALVVKARRNIDKNLLKRALGTSTRVSLAGFSQASVDAYMAAVAAAQAVLDDPSATPEEQLAAKNALLEAQLNLVPGTTEKVEDAVNTDVPASPAEAPAAPVAQPSGDGGKAPAKPAEAPAPVEASPANGEEPAALPQANAAAPGEAAPAGDTVDEQIATPAVQPENTVTNTPWVLGGAGALALCLLAAVLLLKRRKGSNK